MTSSVVDHVPDPLAKMALARCDLEDCCDTTLTCYALLEVVDT